MSKRKFRYYGLAPSMGAIVFTNVNLYYVRKLSCKFQFFWCSGSTEEEF
jgi:hypothetical protein